MRYVRHENKIMEREIKLLKECWEEKGNGEGQEKIS